VGAFRVYATAYRIDGREDDIQTGGKMNWIEKLFSYFRFQDPPPKPRRVNAIPPDGERCMAFTSRKDADRIYDRCKFRRAPGMDRCSIHQKIYDRSPI
jgi:hypothetical protein